MNFSKEDFDNMERDEESLKNLFRSFSIIRKNNQIFLEYLYNCGEDCYLASILFGVIEVLVFDKGFKNKELETRLRAAGMIKDNNMVQLFPTDNTTITSLADIIFSTKGIRKDE